MPYHKDCRHWAGGPRCMNWICHCMASQFDPKLQPFLSYYGDSNMCECEYKSQRDSARRERDEQSHAKNAALRELDKEREKHTETLKLLEKERETGDRLTREVVKLRTALQDRVTLGVTAPVMGGGADTHRQNVRQAVQRFARNDSVTLANHPRRVAEAVYYLLDRDQLQTAAIKHLSERLDTLEPNSKQAAGCPMAPWEMRPSGDFNPG